jgi:hypothetical protein
MIAQKCGHRQPASCDISHEGKKFWGEGIKRGHEGTKAQLNTTLLGKGNKKSPVF